MGVCKHCWLAFFDARWTLKQFVPLKDQSNFFDLVKCNKMHTLFLQTIWFAFSFITLWHVHLTSGTCASAYRSMHCEHFGRDQWNLLVGGTLVLRVEKWTPHWLHEDAPRLGACFAIASPFSLMIYSIISTVTSNAREGMNIMKDVYVKQDVRSNIRIRTNARQDRSDKTKYRNKCQTRSQTECQISCQIEC